MANLPRWPHRDYDVDTVVHMIFGVAFWLSLDQTMRQSHEDLERRAKLIADLILDGVRPRGDHEPLPPKEITS